MPEALNGLSGQTGTPVLFPYGLARDRDANPVTGRYALLEAMELLLRGAGHSGGLSDNGAMTISMTKFDGADNEGEAMKNTAQASGNTNRKAYVIATIGAFLASLGGAPEVIGQNATTGDNNLVLEEIIVTAERRETRLQETPLAISVVTGAQLDSMESRHLSDIVDMVPGLSQETFHPDQPRYGLRGLITIDDSAGTDQSTGLFIDGIYYGRTALLNQNMTDIERVEILKGPQGTLWGHNVVGGSINIITKDPTDELQAEAKFTVGNHGRADFSGRIAGPLIEDRLLGQISFASENTDGYLRNLETGNDLEGRDIQSARGKLIWLPSEGVEIKLSASYETNNSYGHGGVITAYDTSPLSPLVPIPSNLETTMQRTDGEFDTEMYTLNLQTEWALPNDMTLTTLTGYINFSADNPNNNFFPVASALGIIDRFVHLDDESFSQELRLANDPANRLIWQGGVYYYTNDSYKQEDWTQLGSPDNFIGAIVGLYPDTGVNIVRQAVETESWAVFGQATYAVSDWLNITAGARYTTVEKVTHSFPEGDFSPVFLQWPPECDPTGPAFIPGTPCGFDVRGESDWNDFTPKLTIDFPLEDVGVFDSVMPYLTVSKGWKAGGYDPGTTAPEALTPFEPEEALNYEAGIKTVLLNNRMNLNAAFFHTDYDDLQIITIQPVGIGIITENADSSIDGVEWEMSARVTDWLDVSAAYAYYDSHYKPGSVAAGTPIGGNRTVVTPKHSWNVGWTTEWPLPNEFTLSFAGNYSFKDKVFWEPQNGVFAAHPGAQELTKRSILNAYVSLERRNWRLTVWGRNLLDDIYNVSGSTSQSLWLFHFVDFFGGLDSVSGPIGETLSYGVSLEWTYGQ